MRNHDPAGHIRYDGILRVTYPHLVNRSPSLKQEVLRS